ncbi:hypothetical protein WK80_15950 [Burkholderia multivorans]|nr:hypothetical protein WK80_15950 [Burkholderia multivorans]
MVFSEQGFLYWAGARLSQCFCTVRPGLTQATTFVTAGIDFESRDAECAQKSAGALKSEQAHVAPAGCQRLNS